MAPILLIFQTQARVEAFSTNIIRVIFVFIILVLVSVPGIALRRVRGKQPTQVLQAHARLFTTAMIPLALTLLPASGPRVMPSCFSRIILVLSDIM